jgi:hypothetical protein
VLKLRTAKTLRLDVPPVLADADEVIERRCR